MTVRLEVESLEHVDFKDPETGNCCHHQLRFGCVDVLLFAPVRPISGWLGCGETTRPGLQREES